MTETIEKEKVETEEEIEEEIPEEIQIDISDLDLGEEGLEEDPEKKKTGDNDFLDDGSSMPVASHVKKKNKLKGQIDEGNEEISRLNSKIEQLELSQKPVENKLGPMPKRDAYGNELADEEKYESDLRKWHDDAAQDSISRANITNNQAITAQNAVTATKEAVDTHYERAGTFVKENGIEEEVYNQADKNVRSAIESVFTGRGNIITDSMIAALGTGSEKALLIVGRNQEKLDKLKSLFISDPNGLQATAYLGSIIGQYKKKTKQTSLAPSPIPDIKSGERSIVVPESSLKKMWKKADKSGDTMKAYNIYAKAKKAGVDVAKWR